MKRRIVDIFFAAFYPVIDFLLIILSINASYQLYHILEIGKQVYYPLGGIVYISIIVALFTTLVMTVFGVYGKESSLLNMNEIKNVIKGISISFLLIGIILVFSQIKLSRYVFTFSYLATIALLVTAKTFFYHVIAKVKPINGIHKKILIYGAGSLGHALYREIVNSPKLRINPVGFIDDDPEKQNKVFHQAGFDSSRNIRVLGNSADIDRLVKKFEIEEFYIAASKIEDAILCNIVESLKKHNLKIFIIPHLRNIFIHQLRLTRIGNIPLIQDEKEVVQPYYYLKRILDLLLAALLFPLLGLLFGMFALAIKIDSRGPVLFKQNRVGRNGLVFIIYKFRTMYVDTNCYVVSPLDRDDPRITRVGSFLRKISLDELPQIINVLKGEMSFVGPRPEMQFVVAEYDEVHKQRLKVLPGITGLWQLSCDRNKAIHENIDYDLYYVQNASLSLDLAIMIETLIYAFKGV